MDTKKVDLTNTDYNSEQDWAEHTKGVYMNLLSGCRYDPIDHKYKIAPIKYSTTPLEGEKIKFANNQEFIVLFSCLADEYHNKKEVYDKWWEKTNELVDAYKEQMKLEAHIASNNTDLKKLRKEGLLEDQDELDKDK